MNCEDLMNLKQIKSGLKLIAGEKGLYHNIRWIYFADCIQCLDDNYDVGELIYGEELVVITNFSLTENDAKVMELIDNMKGKNIAAFVINEGQISDTIKAYCDQISLPLFELSLDFHLIDFSQIICRILVQEENYMNSKEHLLASILYSENIDRNQILGQANYLEVSLSGAQRVAVFRIVDDEANRIKETEKEQEWMESRNRIIGVIQRSFKEYNFSNLLMYSQMDTVTVIFPSEAHSSNELVTIFESIITKVKKLYGICLKVGIGTAYEYIDEFRLSYQEAKKTLSLSKVWSKTKDIFFYEDMGIYSLLMQITNGKFMDDYVENKLGKLIEADMLQEGNLCDTLEAYLENGCNANATAEYLYIHRNTMRYRMDKIRNILDDDINDLDSALELKLAFAIKKYRKNREK